jgi:hypothetical protein
MRKAIALRAATGLMIITLTCVAGCVPAESARYHNKLVSIMTADHGPERETAVAFGLMSPDEPTPQSAIAVVDENP